MLAVQLLAPAGALLLALGCAAIAEPERTREAPSLTLVPQRVTATIQRNATRLVRLETEHEAFVATPEHPFATPRSGWIRAGRLAPGDWVKSERFGAVRLVSVRSEPAPQQVPVFNLSVASSHAYLVGTSRVLVHNTTCKPQNSESREEAIARLTRERDEMSRRIKTLTKTKTETEPASSSIADLRAVRDTLQAKLIALRAAQRKKQGVVLPNKDERARQHFEAESEAARKALEDAQKELADLESQRPSSEAEGGTLAARKAALEKEIPTLKRRDEMTKQILTWLGELAALEKGTPATDAERRALDEKKKDLRTKLALERHRATNLKSRSKKRTEPEWRERTNKLHREKMHQLRRSATYLRNTERPRDRLELLEDELAALREAPPSETRDAQIQHFTDLIETMKRRVEIRREDQMLAKKRAATKRAREEWATEGKDTSELDQKLQQLERKLHDLRLEHAGLRVRESLLALLDETPWARGPGSVDEAQLHEFERQLAAGLVDEQQLAAIERALDALDPTSADSEQAVLDEAHDVDETLREWEELLHQNPSPERAAELQSSFERLQQELSEERAAVDAAVFQLANEQAFIQTTRAGSSSGLTWQERLVAIHQEQLDLRAQWRARLSARLDSAQRRLEDLQSLDRFRDEASEAELAREIALLARELQIAGG